MGKRGQAYGSEEHFLRYRADHPVALNDAIKHSLGASDASFSWLYPADEFPIGGSREPEGFDFLQNDNVLALWRGFWHQKGKQPTWDGVAKLAVGSRTEWLLLEAKANRPKLCSPPCGAAAGRKKITQAMGKAKDFLGVHRRFSWLGTYYQYANRLTCLYFLTQVARISARLVFVYFYGDDFRDGTPCPSTEAEWRVVINACHLALGLPEPHPLSDFVREVFLPPCPR